MVVFVCGKPDSGKSLYAEKRAAELACGRLYYIATMKVYDEAGRARIEKHVKQREGKGFITIERYTGIDTVTEEMEAPGDSTALLECISNLVGNEMYEVPGRSVPGEAEIEAFAEGLLEDIKKLAAGVANLVIVSTVYDETDSSYDEDTRCYIRTIHTLNRRLSELAEERVCMEERTGGI